jgi:hypothetical protein
MNLHLFFEGKLSREESASAFLATLLEQRPDFRSFFFNVLDQPEPKGDCSITIEHRNVDIRIDYPAAKRVILIENKLRPGALQSKQLVRYYGDELRQNRKSRIVFAFIVPSEGSGTSEMGRLRTELRKKDSGYRVPWELIGEFQDTIRTKDKDKEFINSGFGVIFKIIKGATQEKYPVIGGREIANEIAKKVLQTLQRNFPKIRFSLWRSKNHFTILTNGTNVTIYVDLSFRTENKKPYKPIGIKDRKHLTLRLRTEFALSAKGKKAQTARSKWDRMSPDDLAAIVPSGEHQLHGRWYRRTVTASGSSKQLENQLVEMGRSLIKKFQNLL